jgi:hypothetical protein
MSRTTFSFQTNFTSGELDPQLVARSDTKFYFNGAASLRNAIVRPQGGARRRGGLKYVDTLNATTLSRLTGGSYTYPQGGGGANWTDGSDTTAAASVNAIGVVNPYVAVQVDFTTPTLINMVRVTRVSLQIASASVVNSEWFIQYSSDAVSWTSLGDAMTLKASFYAQGGPISYARKGPITARYWRLARIGATDLTTAILNLYGIDFYQLSATPTNNRLIPFAFNTSQQYMLVAGDKHAVVYTSDVADDTIYLKHASAELPELNWAQSSDVLFLTQEDYSPHVVIRNQTAANWGTVFTVSDINGLDYSPYQMGGTGIPVYNFTTTTSSPAQTLTPSAIEGGVTLTAGGGTPFAASNVGDLVSGGGGLARITRYTSPTVVSAAVLIPFYSTAAMGSGTWTIFGDYEEVWSTTRGYPRSCTFHEGRLWYGGSRDRPHTFWGSVIDNFANFDPGQGLDDEGVEFTLDTDQLNAITNVFSGRDLQIFTVGEEAIVQQIQGYPITPSNVYVRKQTTHGSKAGAKVFDIDGGSIYIQRNGAGIREFIYNDSAQIYDSNNISILSGHLLDNPQDICLMRSSSSSDTDKIIAVNDDGTVACCSTLRTQEVTAWTLWTTLNQDGTQAVVHNCGALPYGTDPLYVITERVINGSTVFCLERLMEDYTLDCSKQVAVAGTTATGFTHLASTNAWVNFTDANGVVTSLGLKAVDGSGNIALGASYTGTIEAGIAYYMTGQTMPVDQQLPEGTARGRKKRITEATFLLRNAGNLTIDSDPVDFAGVSAFNGQKVMEAIGDYDEDGQLSFGQDAPLPLEVVGIVMQLSI